jgi:hypothetical protein
MAGDRYSTPTKRDRIRIDRIPAICGDIARQSRALVY